MKRSLMIVVLAFTFARIAEGGLPRTAVSLYGSDSNPCSLTSPCATFAYAISQTNAGGELIALDSGGYDGFTIDRGMTVTVAPGSVVTVGKEPGGTNWAIKVNAKGERVSIRGVMVVTAGPMFGIVAEEAAATYIDDVMIEGSGCKQGCGIGIFGAKGDLFVNHARIRNVYQGINHNPSERSNAEIRNSTIDYAEGTGIGIDNYATATVRNTNVSHCDRAFSAASLVEDVRPELVIVDCTASSNKVGVRIGSGAIIRMERTAVTRNDTGLLNSGGTMITYGNNVVDGNAVDTSGPMTINSML